MDIRAFEWDRGNEEKNWSKHKVARKEAEEVFSCDRIITFRDIVHSQDEDRFVILGRTHKKRYLYIVFTVRSRNIRIISARDQSRKERKLYEKSST
jgi:uncharacterized DUF497 family protein